MKALRAAASARKTPMSLPALRALVALAPLLMAAAAHAGDKPLPDVPPEPAVQHVVTEDDQVRIDELRVRGQVQSITVTSKIRGFAPYQILPGTGARDPSQVGQSSGQRVWNFAF